MKDQGILRFYIKYLSVPSFRFNEELEATKPQFAYLKELGLAYNLERKAKHLSGWLYFRSTSYSTALTASKELWDKV
jgi:hypothetical protein